MIMTIVILITARSNNDFMNNLHTGHNSDGDSFIGSASKVSH